MKFVPGFQHDIFISYARVDDKPQPGREETKGWVTKLVECLTFRLAQILGREDSYDLWMDHELRGNAPLTKDIEGRVGRSATLIVVLSRGYLASEWCGRELRIFFDSQPDRISSLFIVERDELDQSGRPADLRNKLGYRFWVKGERGQPIEILGTPALKSKEPEYHSKVGKLAWEVAAELERLKGLAGGAPDGRHTNPVRPATIVVPSPEGGSAQVPRVFVAYATDDLDADREGVLSHLEQYGIEVVPQGLASLDPEPFRESANRFLSGSKLFVQLLSEHRGKRPADLPQGYPAFQLELAESAAVPILQWRSPELDLTSVGDAAHRGLLDGPCVRACCLEDFKRDVRVRALAAPEPATQAGPRPEVLVLVDAETSDCELAESLCRNLGDLEVDWVLPLQDPDPEEVRRDLEKRVEECDALVVVYGHVSARWVRDRLTELRKSVKMRESPLLALAVLEGPPEEKAPVNLSFRGMELLDCRRGLDDGALSRFFEKLRGQVS